LRTRWRQSGALQWPTNCRRRHGLAGGLGAAVNCRRDEQQWPRRRSPYAWGRNSRQSKATTLRRVRSYTVCPSHRLAIMMRYSSYGVICFQNYATHTQIDR
jgi:hypothetical protein